MHLSNINKKLGSRKQQVTYGEILSITNNFERIVGKGAFGTVYHGQLRNTQVAVKMLPPSTQGFLQFEAEVLYFPVSMIYTFMTKTPFWSLKFTFRQFGPS